MEFKKLILTGLLGAAFAFSGNTLQAQEKKKVITYGTTKPAKVKVKAQEPAAKEHQTKLFEKAAKLSAKASELAAAGKHEQAAEMARKAAELLTSSYAEANQRYAEVRVKAAEKEAANAYKQAMKAHEYLNQEQVARLQERLTKMQPDIEMAVVPQLAEVLEQQKNIQLKMMDFRELEELGQLKELHNLHALKELKNAEGLEALAALGYVGGSEGECNDGRDQGECEDVQIFRYKARTDGDGRFAFPSGIHSKDGNTFFYEHGNHQGQAPEALFWHQKGHAPQTFEWHSEDGDVKGSFRIELKLEGDAPMVMQGHAPHGYKGALAPSVRYFDAKGNTPKLLPAPGADAGGRYILRLNEAGECETECEEGEWVVDLSENVQDYVQLYTDSKDGKGYMQLYPGGKDGKGYKQFFPGTKDVVGIGEYRVLLSTDAEAVCETECEVICETECETECEVTCEVECEEPSLLPEPRPEYKVRVAPRGERRGLPGIHAAPKPSKKSEAQVLINEMQAELEALRKEIQELRRTMGNDPLVMEYHKQAKEYAANQAFPVSSER